MKVLAYSAFDVFPDIKLKDGKTFRVCPGKVIVIAPGAGPREATVKMATMTVGAIGDAIHCEATVPASGDISAKMVVVSGDQAGRYSVSGQVYSVPIARLTHTGVVQRHSGDIVLFQGAGAHSWKVSVRKNGAAWEYMVAAGGVINPNGSLTTVPEKSWTAIAAGTVKLKLSYGGATPMATIGFSVGESALADNPAVVVFPLAKIEGSDAAGYTVTQYQASDIVLVGAIIPPAWGGHTYTSEQVFTHEASGGLKWADGDGDCDEEPAT